MNNQTLLHRQIHPVWVQAGRVTSQAFKPTPKDQRRLSVYDGDKISPFDAWRHFSEILGFASAGVLAVSVHECQSLELEAEPDPEPFPEHAVIVFDGLTTSRVEKKAKQLRALAQDRGWQYQAEATS